ncbi:RecQ family ATP-dependent DNA helicase [Prevotella veroralis]|uniref:ATP-dependent DNA helicase RecQ n=1 Tax=Prevotella veroralis F0319 TaxID=649761 RepID=C9MN20_9BACT|nr:ATP-dependent DNA helicase RecQ [Prevotella veroralis]EEX19098.1 ATP-dependent DNA helicase, RecQ family [Prevotella veroralis F0319]QUB41152.1 RecQ family ATP-dependent DNA helicase [Prevotella veroralis]
MSYLDILHKYWGYPDFRGIQREIIESIGAGKDTLGLMPTGGGKSLTFQVPALAQEGVCIVITPLIALMKDQVEHLRHKGIAAAAIYSGMSRDAIVTTLENCIFGGVKLLYISPERISSDIFQIKLKHMKVSFITVDEAHCISQWGYDFRPSYLQIAVIRKLVPNVPILALTATATPDVIDDIQERLGFTEKNVFRMSFERKNLVYVVRQAEDKEAEMVHILQSIPKTAIVYCRSRKRTKEIAQLLMQYGISAIWYHAGLEPAVKDQRQSEWQHDKVRVIVATNAFGMGIDKADVRVVIHMDCPSSLEAYFQEAGRAGRDGQKAYAVLLYNGHDNRTLQKRVEDTFPPKEYVQQVYEHLAYFYQIGVNSGEGCMFEFPIDKFCATFKHFPIRANAALILLQRAGYIDYEPNPDNNARVRFLLRRDDLYRLDSLSEKENDVVISLLRNYGGLFTDYGYVDESYIAQEAGLDRNQTYMVLVNLSKKRIIDFIPRKSIPLISYKRDRVDGSNVILDKSVYEERKEQFQKSINSVINYAQNDRVCRSRQLLYYFGEKKSVDCEQCDVCLSHTHHDDHDQQEEIKEKLLAMVADGERHHVTEVRQLDEDWDIVTKVMKELMDEEQLLMEGSYLILSDK